VTAIKTSPRVLVARTLAYTLLEGVGDRWPHTIGVAARAEELAVTVDTADREMLVAAAWLHDIGYSKPLWRTGFHPLDGALYLSDHGWPARLAGLVAHHSAADFVAEALGLREQLDAFPAEDSALADALAYADQTTGPQGHRMQIHDRMADMLERHGTASANARVHPSRKSRLLAAAERVEARLLNS
jgi:HD domain